MQRKEKKREEATRSEIKAQQDDYDRTTKHGENQRNVGGSDVILVCPPK
jgi:hypothetical protein